MRKCCLSGFPLLQPHSHSHDQHQHDFHHDHYHRHHHHHQSHHKINLLNHNVQEEKQVPEKNKNNEADVEGKLNSLIIKTKRTFPFKKKKPIREV